ncbi:MAG: ABC transporter ATP-binding protein [Lachnospiraceae bacterium]|nr:ABC transporter ATP-binding protein [Lachnospiraceae bacterium]
MLDFKNVYASLGGTQILSDICLHVKRGEITTVIGPNGSGKTTLLQCLNGSTRVTSGEIFIDGRSFLSLPPKERAKMVSFLPQVRTIIPSLPTHTLVEHGRFPYLGFSRRLDNRDREIVKSAMDFSQVSEYSPQYTDTLSGGIRQRVFFSMVLAQDCSLLVLDEPTTYLDPAGQLYFLKMLDRLRTDGRTILLVLHDLNQAFRISDTLVVMSNRKIAAIGTPAECRKQHVIEDVFSVKIKKFHDEDGEYYFFV